MAGGKKKQGFLFKSFNILFTVVMFITPTILLGYWYLYLRPTPPKKPVVTVVDASDDATNPDLDDARVMAPPESDTSGDGKPIGPVFFGTGTSDPEPKPVAPPERSPQPDSYEFRTWSDPAGKYKIEAKLQSISGTKATLVKKDGKKITVEIQKLSEADLEYLRAIYRKKGFTASF